MAYIPVLQRQKPVGQRYTPVAQRDKITAPIERKPIAEPIPFEATKTGIFLNTIFGIPKAAKDIFFPTRGFTEEQLKEAKPTFRQTVAAFPKLGAEISTFVGEALTKTKAPEAGESLIEKIVKTPFGQKLADIGDKIREFAQPKTPEEAKAMRIVDAITILPIGSLKIARGTAELIAKSKNASEIVNLLKNEIKGLTDEAAEIIARPLTQIDNVDEVERALNKIDFTLHQAKPTPTISKELQPLAQEARKYKSAEEFVNTPEAVSFLSKTQSGGSKQLILDVKPEIVDRSMRGIPFSRERGDRYAIQIVRRDASGRGVPQWFGFDTPEKAQNALSKYQEIFNSQKSQLTDFYNQVVNLPDLSNLPFRDLRALQDSEYAKIQATGKSDNPILYNAILDELNKRPQTQRDADMLTQISGKARIFTPSKVEPLEEITNIRQVSDQALEEARLNVEGLELTLENHLARPLMKFVSRTTGELPEVIGKPTKISPDTGKVIKAGIFSQKGDDIVANQLGFESLDEAQKALDDYTKGRQNLAEAKLAYKELVQAKREQRLLEADTQKATGFLERAARKTDKEIEIEAKKQAKLKIERIQQRAKERRESAHRDLRELEKSIYRGTPEIIRETPAFQAQAILETNKVQIEEIPTLPKIVIDTTTNIKEKVGLLDSFRTPDRVLNKIGLGVHARLLRNAFENYVAELPNHIDLIKEWKSLLPPESNKRIFRWLDGREISLNKQELSVATEIKEYLADWAERLNLPEDNRIASYVTHIFEKDFIQKEFDEELAKIISDKVAGSVYDPFLEKRLGKKGYIEDTWKALEAYAKRAVRKANIDPALEPIKEASKRLEQSQFDYVKKYIDRVNLRPTKWDTLADNTIKQIAGYRFGQRPTTSLTRFGRQMVYRGALGLNFGSALKNLTQGVNTYATLGEKYTAIGYIKLLTNLGSDELKQVGVLKQDIIQDKIVSAGKTALQKIDKTLFSLFEMAEIINRGAAYWGAKAKAINRGLSEIEAIDYAKKVVRDTQFTYSSIDTPVALSSDLAKTFFQFGTFSIKQTEFLAELLKNKNWAGFMRYIAASLFIVYAVGEAFNIDLQTFNPLNFFARFGRPATLALPSEIVKAIVDSPGYFGQKRDLSEKIEDVLKSSLIYIPAGIQAQKTYRGLKKYEETAQTPSNLLKAVTLGSKNLKEQAEFLGLPSLPELPELPALPKLPTF